MRVNIFADCNYSQVQVNEKYPAEFAKARSLCSGFERQNAFRGL